MDIRIWTDRRGSKRNVFKTFASIKGYKRIPGRSGQGHVPMRAFTSIEGHKGTLMPVKRPTKKDLVNYDITRSFLKTYRCGF
jgi:hypothetical protein